MRWGGNNSYYVRRRAIWKEMPAKISALVKISSIILRRYICLLLCLSPKCNNGENKFALRWNETRGWYLFVFVARPCLPCQSRLRSALPCLTSPAISPSRLPPPTRFTMTWESLLNSLSFPLFSGRQLEAMEGPPLVTRFHRDEDPTGGGGLLRQEEAVACGQRAEPNCKAPSELIKQPPLNPEIIVSVITPGVSLPLGWNWARIAFLSVFHLSYIHTQPELLFWN